jgi:hypothetical protein
MNAIGQQIKNGFLYWKLSTLRVILYGMIVMWGTFLSGVEGFDDLTDLSRLQLIKLCGGVVVSFIGVLLAFLDQTLTKIRPNENQTEIASLTVTQSRPVPAPPSTGQGPDIK